MWRGFRPGNSSSLRLQVMGRGPVMPGLRSLNLTHVVGPDPATRVKGLGSEGLVGVAGSPGPSDACGGLSFRLCMCVCACVFLFVVCVCVSVCVSVFCLEVGGR